MNHEIQEGLLSFLSICDAQICFWMHKVILGILISILASLYSANN